jgi:hypothetical protein
VIVGEVLPSGPVRAVVLAHCPPLALAHVRAPEVPVTPVAKAVLETTERLDSLALRALLHPDLRPRLPDPGEQRYSVTARATADSARSAAAALRVRLVLVADERSTFQPPVFSSRGSLRTCAEWRRT